jgi:hypothetical protein
MRRIVNNTGGNEESLTRLEVKVKRKARVTRSQAVLAAKRQLDP